MKKRFLFTVFFLIQVISFPLIVHALDYPGLPVIHAPWQVDANGYAEITVEPVSGADNYLIQVKGKEKAEDAPWIEYLNQSAPGTYSFLGSPTAQYTVNVYALKENLSSYAQKTIHAWDTEKIISIFSDNTEVLTGETCEIRYSAPEADQIGLEELFPAFNGNYWRDAKYWSNNVEGQVYQVNTDYKKQKIYRAKAKFGEEIIYSNTLTIDVIAPYGIFEKSFEVPYQIEKGQDVTILFDPDPKAKTYSVRLTNTDFGVEWTETIETADIIAGEKGKFVLPTKKLREGNYYVYETISGIGMEQYDGSNCLHIGSIDKNIVLTSSAKEVRTYESVNVYVYAPHAESYWIQALDENGNIELTDSGTGGTEYEYEWYFEETGTKEVTFVVRIGNEIIEKTLEIQVISGEGLKKPDITVPKQVQPGQPVTYYVEPVEGAAYYSIQVCVDNGQEKKIIAWNNEPGSYVLNDLDAGFYWITATISDYHTPDATATAYFRVGEAQPFISFSSDKEHVQIEEDYTLLYRIPGEYNGVITCLNTGKTYATRGNSIQISAEHEGEYTYKLVVDIGTEILSEYVTVIVEKGKEKLTAPMVIMNENVELGQDIVLSVEPVHNAEWYIFTIRTKEEGEAVFEGGLTAEEAHIYNGFLPWKRNLWIEVTSHAKGYESSDPTVVYVQIGKQDNQLPELDSFKTFFVPVELISLEAEAFSGVMVERIVLSEKIVTIGNLAFANCTNLQYINLPDSLTYIAPDAFEGCDNLFIECSAGSLGEEFARAHGFYPVIK